MSKRNEGLPRVAKLTRPGGTTILDVESGIFVGVNNDAPPERPSSRDTADAERRSQPPGSPSSKLPRN